MCQKICKKNSHQTYLIFTLSYNHSFPRGFNSLSYITLTWFISIIHFSANRLSLSLSLFLSFSLDPAYSRWLNCFYIILSLKNSISFFLSFFSFVLLFEQLFSFIFNFLILNQIAKVQNCTDVVYKVLNFYFYFSLSFYNLFILVE